MSWIDETTLKRIEGDNPRGLTSQEILSVFADHDLNLSEATLRKYVQLGLLPRSVRVGQKGKHRGSKGLYPVRVVRQILLIKEMMARQYTIEQIQTKFIFLRGELEELEATLGDVFRKLKGTTEQDGERISSITTRDVSAARDVGRDLMGRLRSLERRLTAKAMGAQNESNRELTKIAG